MTFSDTVNYEINAWIYFCDFDWFYINLYMLRQTRSNWFDINYE